MIVCHVFNAPHGDSWCYSKSYSPFDLYLLVSSSFNICSAFVSNSWFKMVLFTKWRFFFIWFMWLSIFTFQRVFSVWTKKMRPLVFHACLCNWIDRWFTKEFICTFRSLRRLRFMCMSFRKQECLLSTQLLLTKQEWFHWLKRMWKLWLSDGILWLQRCWQIFVIFCLPQRLCCKLSLYAPPCTGKWH